MKTAIIFIGLKISEILGVGIIFTLLSLCWALIDDKGNFWLNGLFGIIIPFIILIGGGLILFGLYVLIKKNIEWAKQLDGGK